jgi:hypothetical protein
MPTARRVLPVALLVAGVLAPASVRAQTPPKAAEPRDLMVVSGDVVIRRGQEVGEVVVVRGRVLVAGVARGDVVVLSGHIEVTGQVSGSFINVRGPVALGSSSHVAGDVLAGERVRLAEGAVVDGDVRSGVTFALTGPIAALGRFAPWLAVWASVLALGLALLLLAPRSRRCGQCRAERTVGEPRGAAASLALPVLGAVAVISLVWLPLGLGLLAGLFLLYSVGVAWSAFALGRLIWREPRGRVMAFAFGWAILAALAVIPVAGAVVWVGAVAASAR